MCLLIVEILFLIGGLWAIVSGKLPSRLFKILFGKGEYMAEPRDARLFGLLLASPLLISLLLGFILSLLFGTEGLVYANILEILIIITVSTIAIFAARKFKHQPLDEAI